MTNTQRVLCIYFASAPQRRAMTCRQWLRAVRKCRRGLYLALLAKLVGILTRSSITHVSVGYDGAVLHPNARGNEYWALIPYTIKYPNLLVVFAVPVDRDIDLEHFEQGPKRIWPTILRWLRNGRGPATQDCTCIALDCLRQGGVDVPATLVGPCHLYDWLKEKHYGRIDLDQAARGATADQHSADRMAGKNYATAAPRAC